MHRKARIAGEVEYETHASRNDHSVSVRIKSLKMTHTEFISLKKAAKSCPVPVSLASIWRWSTRGIRGILLRTVVQGGRRYTTLRWVEEFVAATTAGGVTN